MPKPMELHDVKPGELDDVRIGAGAVCRIANITHDTLTRWCEAVPGLAANTPPSGTNGQAKGPHRRFSLLETLAMTYAEAWRRNGAGPAMVRTIIAGITSLGLDEVARAVREGRTFWLPLPVSERLPGGGAKLTTPPQAVIHMLRPEVSEETVGLALRAIRRLDLGACLAYVRKEVAARLPAEKAFAVEED